MTDRRDPDPAELRERIAELESTLVELREALDGERRDVPKIPRGLPGGGRPAPRPPRLREVLRFTEEYTIPTLVSILEANVRLLELAGATLRALDPERTAMPGDTDGGGAVRRAIDAGRGLSTERLASSLDELNDALAGTDAPDPEARELLAEAETLSAEIQDRLQGASDRADGSGPSKSPAREADAVHLDVSDGSDPDSGDGDASEDDDASAESPEPDVDAELDSIREEVRGATGDDEGAAGDAGDADDATGADAGDADARDDE